VILLVLGVMKVLATSGTVGMHLDGGFYTDVALNVRDGLGFTTDMSLYHKGYTHFPHPTSVYPVWPVLYGLLSRVVDYTLVAHWLPALLYMASLCSAFLLGRRVWAAPLLPHFHGGHLAALLLGLNTEFFVYTSLPYTEGLGWLLLTLFCWRLLGLTGRLTVAGAAELAAWSALLVLTRAQFLLVPIALMGAFGVGLLGPGRRKAALHGLVFSGVFALPIGAWTLRSKGFLLDAGLLTLLRFDQAQATALLPPMQTLVSTEGVGGLLLDRASGLLVAFDLRERFSYAASFHSFHFAMLAALPVALGALLGAGRDRLASWARWVVSPQAFGWLALALLAAGGLASIHLAHKDAHPAWYFHRRHALVVIFTVYASLLALLASPRSWARWTGRLLLLSGLAWGLAELGERAWFGRVRAHLGRDTRAGLVDWLSREEERYDGLTVALMAHEPQRLGYRTEAVRYHWFYEKTTRDDLAVMCDSLGVTYVILQESRTRDWAIHADGALEESGFRKLRARPSGFSIFVCP